MKVGHQETEKKRDRANGLEYGGGRGERGGERDLVGLLVLLLFLLLGWSSGQGQGNHDALVHRLLADEVLRDVSLDLGLRDVEVPLGGEKRKEDAREDDGRPKGRGQNRTQGGWLLGGVAGQQSPTVIGEHIYGKNWKQMADREKGGKGRAGQGEGQGEALRPQGPSTSTKGAVREQVLGREGGESVGIVGGDDEGVLAVEGGQVLLDRDVLLEVEQLLVQRRAGRERRRQHRHLGIFEIRDAHGCADTSEAGRRAGREGGGRDQTRLSRPRQGAHGERSTEGKRK